MKSLGNPGSNVCAEIERNENKVERVDHGLFDWTLAGYPIKQESDSDHDRLSSEEGD